MPDNVVAFPNFAGSGTDDRALARVFAAYMASATIWLLFTTAVGLLVSFKFAYPDFATAPALSFGRLRAIHTNGTFYAWASQALIGLALFIAARSSGTRLYSERLAWISLALLNVAAVLGTITLDLGFNYGQEYREWLWWIRAILGFGLITSVWNMLATVERREGEHIYLSNWYTIGGMLWTIIIVLVSILPWYQFGLGQVAVQAFFMHNAVGLWFTPLSLGVFYYALPKLLNRPIYSYSLGVFAFISLAGNVGQTNYSAAKAGVAAMAVTWTKGLTRCQIRVAGIARGFTNTRMVAKIPQKILDRIISTIPLRDGLQTPPEIARTALLSWDAF